MRSLCFIIQPPHDGLSVQKYARNILKLSARAFIKQKYTDNGMLRNGVPCRSIDLLHAGDRFELRVPAETPAYEAIEGPVDILYEDEDFLAVNKQAGLPVHPSKGTGITLLNAVAYYFMQKQACHVFRPIYRLDKDTSGILLVAKHRIAASCSSLTKRYYAICEGTLSGEGLVDQPIRRSDASIITRETGSGKPATTKWKALACTASHTLLELDLLTGRTHQIRVHMASVGHPLAGDTLYGGSRSHIARQALHCGLLTVDFLPIEKRIDLHADFPQDMLDAFPELFCALHKEV